MLHRCRWCPDLGWGNRLMANVPTFTPGKSPDGIAAAPETKIDPDAFGAGIASSLRSFGDQMGKAGDVLAASQNRQAEQAGMVRANNAQNSHIDQVNTLLYGDPNDSTKPGFLNQQGPAAIAAWNGFVNQLKQTQQNAGSGLQAGTTARDQFDQNSMRYTQMALDQARQHVAAQAQDYARQSVGSTVQMAHQVGVQNYGDPRALSLGLGRSQQVLTDFYATTYGMKPSDPVVQQKLQDDRDQFFDKAITAALQNGQPIEAQQRLLANRGLISPTAYASIAANLRPHVVKADADAVTRELLGQPADDGVVAIPRDANPDDVMDSQIRIESGRQQFDSSGAPLTSGVGGADAPVGAGQIRPSSAKAAAARVGLQWDENRLRNDQAYNMTVSRSYKDMLLDRYGGNQTLATAAYNAGPGRVDEWLKTYGDPRTGAISDTDWLKQIPFRESRSYVSRAGLQNHGKPALSAGYSPPDYDKILSKVDAATAGMDPEVGDRVRANIITRRNQWQVQTATQRAALEKQVSGIQAAQLNGDDSYQPAITPIIGQFQTLYPAQEAEQKTHDLVTGQQAATVFAGMKNGTPQEIADGIRSLQDPNSAGSKAAVRSMKGMMGATASPATGMNGQIAPEDYQLHQQFVERVAAFAQRRQEALAKDPVAAVSEASTVQTAQQHLAHAMQSNDQNAIAQAQRDAITASDAMQTHQGVLRPRILTEAQGQHDVQMLTDADPAKTSAAQILDALAGRYGGDSDDSAWPRVFGEYQEHFGLSPDYVALGIMNQPNQVIARADMERAIHAGSEQQLTAAAGVHAGSDAGKIDDPTSGLPTLMRDFLGTTMGNRAGLATYNAIYGSVKRLVLYYMANGKGFQTAMNDAYDGILGRKYDFNGTMRVPKGMLSATEDATSRVMDGLAPDSLAPEGGDPNLTQAQRQEIALSDARKGSWIPNAHETGLTLMSSSTFLPVLGKDGKPITVLFQDIRNGKYPPRLPGINSVASISPSLVK
ncbi:transglycosylase SLT domain-containing protein [Gluconacetobacter johannae]|nr:transglycosylase SLT domain-containing protein [Gluconacetobacter johannae]